MGSRLRRYAPLTFVVALLAIAAYGAISALIFLAADWTTSARNALVIPVCLLPTAAFLVWLQVGYGKTLDNVQNLVAGCWICPLSAVVAYLTTYLPAEFVKATFAVMFVHAFIWLGLAQLTRRLYRAKRQANIARASARPVDDPEVRNLANNNVLATATALAMLTTAQIIVTMGTYASDYFNTGAIRGIGMIIGCTVGLILFNLHPTQSDIREIASQHQQSEGTSKPGCR